MASKFVENIILGGGISGLSAAFYLKTLGRESEKILLLEGSSRLGGWLHSCKTEDGSVHELGTRSIRVTGLVGKNTLDMVDTLNLETSLLPVTSAHPAVSNRFLYAEGKIHKLPASLSSLFRRSEPLSKSLAVLLAREPFRRKVPVDDESLHSFFERRFGLEFATYLVDAFCRGIFAGKSSELSIKSCFPHLFEIEQKYGSLILGSLLSKREGDSSVGNSPLVKRATAERWLSWSMKAGLQELPDRLGSYLTEKDVQISTDTPCRRIEFKDKVARIHTKDKVLETERLFCSLPSTNLAPLLAPEHSDLAKSLSEIPSATVAVVNLEFQGSVLPLQGFGYLVPSCEPSNVLGVVFDSCTFPEHDTPVRETTRMTCMMGGEWFEELFGDPEVVCKDKLLLTALESIKAHLNIHEKPIYSNVSVHRDCIPQYTIGHSKRLDSIHDYIQNHKLPLTLLGSSYHGVSVNDCIYNARKAVLEQRR
ncbi:protoporphyrinogen oxidase-like [Apostichopus japonicus]|uniref:protoporphyrinogen oxidase-like n=1 Tax=Stichopus japonicus TaxID=307972 RepID=UPI003AB75B91